MQFTPEQCEVVAEIASDTARQVSTTLDIPLTEVRTFINNVISFATCHLHYFESPYSIALTTKHASDSPLSFQQILSLRAKNLIPLVDSKLNVESYIPCDQKLTSCSNLTRDNKIFLLHINARYFYEVFQGHIINEDGFAGNTSNYIPSSRFFKNSNEISNAIQDHFNECVIYEKEVQYWHDKPKRILVAEIHGKQTETIFHTSLYHWLRRYVSKLKIFAEASGFGQNKTDITVVDSNGSYVVEVKWLGINANSTQYGQTRIDEGLCQIKTYLEQDPSLIGGHLVLYDARHEDEHKNNSMYNHEFKHCYCDSPLVLFLISDTPSTEAKKTVRSAKPKQSKI